MKHFYPLVALAEGRVNVARGQMEQAMENFTRAEDQALDMQRRPSVVLARAGALQVLGSLGRTSEAETQRQRARAMIDEIAGLFDDEKLRGIYLQSAVKKLE